MAEDGPGPRDRLNDDRGDVQGDDRHEKDVETASEPVALDRGLQKLVNALFQCHQGASWDWR